MLSARPLPGKVDSVVQILSDLLHSDVRQLSGFRCCLALTQADVGVVLAVTLWENEVHAVDWETGSRYRKMAAQMTPLVDGPPRLDGYDVSICL